VATVTASEWVEGISWWTPILYVLSHATVNRRAFPLRRSQTYRVRKSSRLRYYNGGIIRNCSANGGKSQDIRSRPMGRFFETHIKYCGANSICEDSGIIARSAPSFSASADSEFKNEARMRRRKDRQDRYDTFPVPLPSQDPCFRAAFSSSLSARSSRFGLLRAGRGRSQSACSCKTHLLQLR
jgi:hypothetical protein